MGLFGPRPGSQPSSRRGSCASDTRGEPLGAAIFVQIGISSDPGLISLEEAFGNQSCLEVGAFFLQRSAMHAQ